MIDASVLLQGTLFEQRVASVIERIMRGFVDEYADQGRDDVEDESKVFKRSTGRFVNSLVTTQRESATIIHSLVVYDDWLEWGGRGGFDGYSLFEKATNTLEDQIRQDSSRIAEALVRGLD